MEIPSKPELDALVQKYRWHWQFVGDVPTDPNQRGAMGDTMLHFAVEAGSLEDMDVLVVNGANVNVVGDIGNTPLHSAALMGNVAAAKKLLELGADPNRKNDFDQTPADIARIGDHCQVADVIESYLHGV
jgi:ankyrin repeat protein